MGQTQSNPSRGGGGDVGSRNRALAKKEAILRREFSQKSQDAWAQGNKAKAKEYSNTAKTHQRAMEAYNALAAAEIFRENNPAYHLSNRSGALFLLGLVTGVSATTALAQIDLHGLHVTEALPLVQEHLKLCRRNSVKRTTIITGKGLHSVGGIAKIKPQVEKMLAEERVKVVREAGKVNEGAFIVELAADGEDVPGWADWFLGGLFGRRGVKGILGF